MSSGLNGRRHGKGRAAARVSEGAHHEKTLFTEKRTQNHHPITRLMLREAITRRLLWPCCDKSIHSQGTGRYFPTEMAYMLAYSIAAVASNPTVPTEKCPNNLHANYLFFPSHMALKVNSCIFFNLGPIFPSFWVQIFF